MNDSEIPVAEQVETPVAGRPLVLDELKRQKIVTLVGLGCSRRTAARWVGCAPSTISRTAARDPQFADQLAQAEQTAEIDALRLIRNAARDQRYWRAAAWLLERRNPEDFGPRPPTLFTGQEVVQILVQVSVLLREELPEENCHRALDKLNVLIGAFQNDEKRD